MEFKIQDVRFDTYTTGTGIPILLTATHIPTGLYIRTNGEMFGSKRIVTFRVREALIKELEAMVNEQL